MTTNYVSVGGHRSNHIWHPGERPTFFASLPPWLCSGANPTWRNSQGSGSQQDFVLSRLRGRPQIHQQLRQRLSKQVDLCQVS